MEFKRDSSNPDEYYVTALQIFDYFGADSTGSLRVDTLMDKFAPFVKTNKAEYTFLKSLLDPDQTNPEINVTRLANVLNKYSESQKTKVDFEESFNLKSGQVPQDSDSGISTDGFQLLEDLQCELREKAHLALRLRSQLDVTDRHHEEALAALTAERDSLRAHLNMLREENMTLVHVRRDYEEACDRLCSSEQALNEARREIDSLKRRAKQLHEQVTELDIEKITLQELLTKSKDECHRINEMYASRQSALLEENETLKTEHADFAARLQDQEEFMQQMIKEKVLLEMELKDVLNKTNQTEMHPNRSIDVSFTEDQMLTALDSLNAESKFVQEPHLSNEDSFSNSMKEDHGRLTNMSLFDEIRLSFGNMSRQNTLEFNKRNQCDTCKDHLNQSFSTAATQTSENYSYDIKNREEISSMRYKMSNDMISSGTQSNENEAYIPNHKDNLSTVIKIDDGKNKFKLWGKCDDKITQELNKNNLYGSDDKTQKCIECDKSNKHIKMLENDLRYTRSVLTKMQQELNNYNENFDVLQKFLNDGSNKNQLLQVIIKSLEAKISILEATIASQKLNIDSMQCETCDVETQSDSEPQISVSTQVDVPCMECEKRKALVPHRSLRKYLWDPLKCLFQIFAVICFVCAICVLYGVTRNRNARCPRDPVPWSWLAPQDFMDLFLRIEYVADVPM